MKELFQLYKFRIRVESGSIGALVCRNDFDTFHNFDGLRPGILIELLSKTVVSERLMLNIV